MSKMTPEKARQLRDGGTRHRPAPFTPQPGTRKHRELRFDPKYPGQVERARQLLSGLEGMEIEDGPDEHALAIWYEVLDYTLEGLEEALQKQGFRLDDGLFTRMARAFVHFCEETQLRNLHGPERLIKKSQEVYSSAWDRRQHGDHDETPADLRQDR